jgi:hypothetical protein
MGHPLLMEADAGQSPRVSALEPAKVGGASDGRLLIDDGAVI